MVMTKERFKHYTINIDSLDQEHWNLCQQMDQTIVLAKDNDFDKLTALLLELQEALKAHFLHEETLMTDLNYPFIRSHQEEHHRMQRSMDSFVIRTRDTHFMSFYFPQELEDLFLHHIEYADRQFSEHIEKLKKDSSNQFTTVQKVDIIIPSATATT